MSLNAPYGARCFLTLLTKIIEKPEITEES